MTPQAQLMMSERAAKPASPGESAGEIFRILGWQAGAGVLTAAVVLAAFGSAAGFSAALGAAICFIPSLAFGGFVAAGLLLTRSPRLHLHGFYAGEAFKLAVTVVLFTIAFTTVGNLNPLFLFIGFMATQMTMLATLLRG